MPPTSPVSDALDQGSSNTLRVAVAGIVLATVLGTLIGVGRLSRTGSCVVCATYVEIIRNIPLLVLLLFAYLGVVLARLPDDPTAWELGHRCSSSARHHRVLVRGAQLLRRGVVLVAARGGGARAVLVARAAAATGMPARSGLWAPRCSSSSSPVWLILRVDVTAPEVDGRITVGGTRYPSFFASCSLWSSIPPATSQRSSADRFRRCPRSGRGRQALALWVPANVVRRAPSGIPHRGATTRQPVPQPDRRTRRWARSISYFELTKVTQLAVGQQLATRAVIHSPWWSTWCSRS